MQKWLAALALALCAAAPIAVRAQDVPLNGMHVLGSHNSYRPALTEQTLAEQRRILGEHSAAVEYGHPSIARQLDLGLACDRNRGEVARLGKDGTEIGGAGADVPELGTRRLAFLARRGWWRRQ
jgi:hypothetical protein